MAKPAKKITKDLKVRKDGAVKGGGFATFAIGKALGSVVSAPFKAV